MTTRTTWFLSTILLVISWCAAAPADYGWLPKFKHLNLKIGSEYRTSSENYVSDGTRSDIFYQNYTAGIEQQVSFSEFRFLLEPEYTFAQDWAVRLRVDMVYNFAEDISNSPTSQIAVPSATALGDITAGLKWNLKKRAPNLTVEATAKIPTYSKYITQLDTILPGDGSVDLGLTLHTRFNLSRLFVDLSPGLLMRFQGYANAFTLRGGAGMRFAPAYFMAYFDSIFSFTDPLLFDSSGFVHDAGGAAGSYFRLSGSPSGLTLGGRFGIKLTDDYSLEGFAGHSVYGKRYPNFIEGGVAVVVNVDFFRPDTRSKIHAIPFDSEPDTAPTEADKESSETKENKEDQ